MSKAELLRSLHQTERPLVLLNAWDAASARVFAASGAKAIATTSAGVAYCLGYADGQQVPAAEMIAAIARICRVVEVPVTADVEAGYGDLEGTVRGLIAAGAVGLNLEDMEGEGDDALVPLAQQLERIRTVKNIAAGAGVPVVLNARTDIYLAHLGPAGRRFDCTVERLRAFAGAGADCVFVPGIVDENTIERLAAAIGVPLNILAVAGSPPISRLAELGVRRVSVGSGPMRATMGLARRIAAELLGSGTYGAMVEGAIPYPEANRLMAGDL